MTSMRTTLLLASLLAVLAAGCRKREPSKVEIFDETATPAQTEALGSLAPLWPAPERVVLDNGLLVHWLHEDDTPALHLRLILPTHGLKAAHQGAPSLTVARALLQELEALTPRLAVRAALDVGVDRVELVKSTASPGRPAPRWPASPMSSPAIPRAPSRPPAGRLQAELRPLDADALATSELVAILQGGKAERERVDRAALQGLDDAVLLDAWRALTDPRQALLVVHTPSRLADAGLAAATADVATRWRQKVSLLPGNEGRASLWARWPACAQASPPAAPAST